MIRDSIEQVPWLAGNTTPGAELLDLRRETRELTKESLAAAAQEIAEKEMRVRCLLAEKSLAALVLTTRANFAWLTCGGDNRVVNASETGVASAVITPEAKYIVCDNIEAGRIMDEEVGTQGFKFHVHNWWEGSLADQIRKLATGRIGSDTTIPGTEMVRGDIAPLRYSLTSEEIERYRWLGKNTGGCMAEACCEIRRGMTEHEIAAVLGDKLLGRGIIPDLILVAADERIEKYRHPIPTDNTLGECAMLVTCARKWGLIVSTTRIVRLGPVSPELRRKHDAVMAVDAELIAGTRPGSSVGDVFRAGVAAYARTGFADEWKLHHQGGPTGYAGREYRGMPDSKGIVQPNQAFAWNPSITGTKSEDTIVALTDRTEVLSAHGDWPMKPIQIGSTAIPRPDILEM